MMCSVHRMSARAIRLHFLIEMPAWSVLDQTMIGRIVEVVVRDGERAVFKNQIGDHRVSGK